MAVAAAMLGLHEINHVINNSDVKSALEKLELPVYVVLGLAIIGAVTFLSADHENVDS